MIFKVNSYDSKPTFFVDETTFNSNLNSQAGKLIIGGINEAQTLLNRLQQEVLIKEAVRFSVCATFINGNDTTWREIQDSDPEDTICQVFNHIDGTYTQVATKTEAFNLNEQRKQEFLIGAGLDKVYELAELPVSGIYDPNTYGLTVGAIPVEVM